MKRILGVFICCLFCVGITCHTMALPTDKYPYAIYDNLSSNLNVDLSIYFPQKYMIVTRDLSNDDYIFEDLDLDSEESDALLQSMIDNDAYLMGFNPDLDKQISINILPAVGALSFNDIANETLLSEYTEMEKQMIEAEGGAMNSINVYQSHMWDDKYIKSFLYTPSDGGSEILQYLIVKDELAYNIQLFSFGSKITRDDENMMDEIIDSMVFKNNLDQNLAGEWISNDGQSAYTFTTTGMGDNGTFEIPYTMNFAYTTKDSILSIFPEDSSNVFRYKYTVFGPVLTLTDIDNESNTQQYTKHTSLGIG